MSTTAFESLPAKVWDRLPPTVGEYQRVARSVSDAQRRLTWLRDHLQCYIGKHGDDGDFPAGLPTLEDVGRLSALIWRVRHELVSMRGDVTELEKVLEELLYGRLNEGSDFSDFLGTDDG